MLTKESFQKLWRAHFPEAVPIPHSFREIYHDRWFRIHSLPDSQRFANTDFEWDILLRRQNEIISDLVEKGISLMLVTGEFVFANPDVVEMTTKNEVLNQYSWLALDELNLNQLDPDNYEEGDRYRPSFAEIVWGNHHHNKLLKAIADDELRAFFLSFELNLFIAPYDGGVDIFLKDSQIRDHFRNKFREWLSKRDDGL